jgi:hypothetical protein
MKRLVLLLFLSVAGPVYAEGPCPPGQDLYEVEINYKKYLQCMSAAEKERLVIAVRRVSK